MFRHVMSADVTCEKKVCEHSSEEMSALPTNKLGPFAGVGKQGFGCMGMSAFYGSAKTTTEADAKAVFHEAVAAGVTLFNSADFYGPLNADGFGHNLRYLNITYKYI
jgi:hypothetical protein